MVHNVYRLSVKSHALSMYIFCYVVCVKDPVGHWFCTAAEDNFTNLGLDWQNRNS